MNDLSFTWALALQQSYDKDLYQVQKTWFIFFIIISSTIDSRCLAYFKPISNFKEIRNVFSQFYIKQAVSADTIMYKNIEKKGFAQENMKKNIAYISLIDTDS